jgi:argininosuccinate lyase
LIRTNSVSRVAVATAIACLNECLMITAKLPSGYQRDLQRLKPPVFRAVDLVIDSVAIMAHVVDTMTFQPQNIVLDDSLNAAEEAYRLVTSEGIPFREAYRRVAEKYAK